MKIKWLFLCILFLILISPAFSLGISPAKYIFDYAPGQTHDVSVTIYGEPNKLMRAVVSGPTNDSIVLEESEFTLDYQGVYTLHAQFTIPGNLKPGMNEWKITIEDVNPTGSGTVIATVSMALPIRVRVPFPEKYAAIQLHVGNTQIGEPAHFVVDLNNYGSKVINSATGTVEIFDLTNSSIDVLQLPTINNITPSEQRKMEVDWDTTNVKLGKYLARAIVYYDEKSTSDEESFSVGDILIEILNVTSEAEKDSISEISVLAESKWNEPIENIYAKLFISKDGDQIDELTTPNGRTNPWSRTTLKAYWDTHGLEEGDYDLRTVVYYANKSSEMTTTITIKNKLPISPQGAIILLLMGLIVLFGLLLIRKRRRPQYRRYYY